MKSVFSELFMYAFLCAAAVLGQSPDEICSTPSRPDCRKAVAVFEAFQKAVTSDERKAVVSMVRFPLRVRLSSRRRSLQLAARLQMERRSRSSEAQPCWELEL